VSCLGVGPPVFLNLRFWFPILFFMNLVLAIFFFGSCKLFFVNLVSVIVLLYFWALFGLTADLLLKAQVLIISAYV